MYDDPKYNCSQKPKATLAYRTYQFCNETDYHYRNTSYYCPPPSSPDPPGKLIFCKATDTYYYAGSKTYYCPIESTIKNEYSYCGTTQYKWFHSQIFNFKDQFHLNKSVFCIYFEFRLLTLTTTTDTPIIVLLATYTVPVKFVVSGTTSTIAIPIKAATLFTNKIIRRAAMIFIITMSMTIVRKMSQQIFSAQH